MDIDIPRDVLSEFNSFFTGGMGNSNIFSHVDSCLDSENALQEPTQNEVFIALSDVFFKATSKYANAQKEKNADFLLAEKNLFLSLVDYIYNEAPFEEQNMFLVLELLYAAKHDVSEDSDLDRLFNEHLKEKKTDHSCLLSYKTFRNYVDEQDVVWSLIARCSDYDVRRSYHDCIVSGDKIHDFAWVLVNNTQPYITVKTDTAEVLLISTLLGYIHQTYIEKPNFSILSGLINFDNSCFSPILDLLSIEKLENTLKHFSKTHKDNQAIQFYNEYLDQAKCTKEDLDSIRKRFEFFHKFN